MVENGVLGVPRSLEGRFGSSFAVVHYFVNFGGDDDGDRPFWTADIDSGPLIDSGKMAF